MPIRKGIASKYKVKAIKKSTSGGTVGNPIILLGVSLQPRPRRVWNLKLINPEYTLMWMIFVFRERECSAAFTKNLSLTQQAAGKQLTHSVYSSCVYSVICMLYNGMFSECSLSESTREATYGCVLYETGSYMQL